MEELFNWFSNRVFLDIPNYFWFLCLFVLLTILFVCLFISCSIKKNRRIKTLKILLDEERTFLKAATSEEEVPSSDKEVAPKSDELSVENERLSQELVALQDKNKELSDTVDSLKDQLESAEGLSVSLDDELATTKEKLAETTSLLEKATAKNVECNSEIVSYKATNDILSKSLDNYKAQLAEKNDEVEELKASLSKFDGIQKKAAETAEDNKVLLKAFGLFINTKDGSEQKPEPIEIKKKKPSPRSKKVEENLEDMKRPDLMHLAKKEGVQRFARKSNEEIIRLIRENRSKK